MHIFVTGTDTGIGKTVVATMLALKLTRHYWKPIQSGTQDITDSQWAADRLGAAFVQPEVYRLKMPLSPHASAAYDGITIDMATIVANIPKQPTVIEGAGGVFVPLNHQAYIIDLITYIPSQVVLVARSSLGTINHTLLSLQALRQKNIPILGVVMVGDINHSNREAIEAFGNTRVIGCLPMLQDLSRDALITASHAIVL